MCCEHQVLISREFENDLHLEENVPLCCGDVVYPGQVGHVLEVGGLDDVGLGRHVVRLQGQVIGRGLERTPGDVEELLGRHQRPAVRGHARLEVVRHDEAEGEVGALGDVRRSEEELPRRDHGRTHHLHAHVRLYGPHHLHLAPQLVTRPVILVIRCLLNVK